MRPVLALGALCLVALPCGAADPPTKTDRYGDPLPAGAMMRLGTLRTRAPITGFGIEKDGTVVTVGPGAEVRRWHNADDKSEEPMRLPLKGRENGSNSPQVSPDGKFVAACSAEKVFVWEAPTDPKSQPKEVAAFEIAGTRLFQFSPDGTKLVVTARSSEPAAAYVCAIKTGKMTPLDAAPRYIEGVHFSGDGKRVGIVGEGVQVGSEVYFLDADTGKQLAKHQPRGRMSSAFALNRAGDVLAAPVSFSGPRNEFHFTDPLTGQKLDGLTGPEVRGLVFGQWVTFAPDGKTLLSSDRYSIRWWDPGAAKLIRAFEGIAAQSSSGLQLTQAQFSPDGKTLVAHNGCALLRWEVGTGKPLFPEQDLGHGGPINGLSVSPDGKRIATCGMDSRVCVWEAATGKELSHAPASWSNASDIAFSPDGKFLYVGGPEIGEVTKLDAATGKAVTRFTTDPKGPKQASAQGVQLSRDGKTVFALTGPYSTSDPGFITTWDANTGERTKSTDVPVLSGRLSPGAAYVFVGEPGLLGRVYAVGAPQKDLLAGTKLRGWGLSGHFSDDAKWFIQIVMERAEGGQTFSAVVISTLSWEVTCTIPMVKNGRAALSPDGRTLAVADGEKLEFYDTATTRSLGNFRVPAGEWAKAHFGDIHVLRFTPDGTKLITGHLDTTALVWPVPPRPAK
jgi:WD40 repeat protein